MRFTPRLLALIVLPALAAGARADMAGRPYVPPPRPVRPAPLAPAPLVIEVDPTADHAVLLIPRRLADAGRAAAADRDGADGRPPIGTAVGGVALALAFASGGLWLARQGRLTPAVAAAAVVTVLALGVGTSALWADAVPLYPRPVPTPRLPFGPPVPMPVLPGGAVHRVVVRIVDQGDVVKLIVNPAALPKVVPNPAPKEAPRPHGYSERGCVR